MAYLNEKSNQWKVNKLNEGKYEHTNDWKGKSNVWEAMWSIEVFVQGREAKQNVPQYIVCITKPVFHSMLSSKVHGASQRMSNKDGN